MGFKTKPKYKLVRENWAGSYMSGKDEIELSEKQLLDLSYGIIPFEMIDTIIKWLKQGDK